MIGCVKNGIKYSQFTNPTRNQNQVSNASTEFYLISSTFTYPKRQFLQEVNFVDKVSSNWACADVELII